MSIEGVRLDVTNASRILSSVGVLDAFGHVSCRHPENPDRFLMSRRISAGEVTPEDIYEHDLDGSGIDNDNAPLFLERFIHAEIFRARAEVVSVVHSHSYSVVPFTVVAQARLKPIAHVCGFLEGIGPAFDVADHAGDASDLLIRNSDLGRAFADHLGSANVALMRGHGFTAVGSSIAQAVYRAIYTEVNSRLQLDATRLGEARFLSSGEAAACEATLNPQLRRIWDFWVSQYGYEATQ